MEKYAAHAACSLCIAVEVVIHCIFYTLSLSLSLSESLYIYI